MKIRKDGEYTVASPRYYLKDHLGNNRVVVTINGSVQQNNIYYALGGTTAQSTGTGYQQYKFTDKEYDPMHGLNQYDFTARQYDPAVGRFTSIDPLAEKYYHLSPYSYCSGDPVNAVDPDGRYIEVMQLEENRYKITGGHADKDQNVYVDYGTKKQRSIGKMLTRYSFMDDNAKPMIGAIIDLSDRSGSNFLNGFIDDTPELLYYMLNGYGGQKYDFKRAGTKEGDKNYDNPNYHYRGMEITLDGETYITSARDIGNFAAGYIAGKYDLPWGASETAFDMLETKQQFNRRLLNDILAGKHVNIEWKKEGKPTRYAQRAGYVSGQSQSYILRMSNVIRKLQSIF